MKRPLIIILIIVILAVLLTAVALMLFSSKSAVRKSEQIRKNFSESTTRSSWQARYDELDGTLYSKDRLWPNDGGFSVVVNTVSGSLTVTVNDGTDSVTYTADQAGEQTWFFATGSKARITVTGQHHAGSFRIN